MIAACEDEKCIDKETNAIDEEVALIMNEVALGSAEGEDDQCFAANDHGDFTQSRIKVFNSAVVLTEVNPM